jgi:hypothetical protein
MSIITRQVRTATTVAGRPTTAAAARPDVLAEALARGWYGLLFDLGPVTVDEFAAAAGIDRRTSASWIDGQLAAGVLRDVGPDDHGRPQVLLPGEHVTALLGDHGGPELSGARAMAALHRDRIAPAIRSLRPAVSPVP